MSDGLYYFYNVTYFWGYGKGNLHFAEKKYTETKNNALKLCKLPLLCKNLPIFGSFGV